MPLWPDSQLYRSQAQGVRNHRNRAEAHRGRGQDRAQQQSEEWIEHARSNGYANRVIEEGKEQILPDVSHRGLAQLTSSPDAPQIPLPPPAPPPFHVSLRPCPHR